MAQLASPDMTLPIQYAITFPMRLEGQVKRLNLCDLKSLTFEKPEKKRFPCLDLARSAFLESEAHTIAFKAAN